MILARHAEATFWAGRQLERVEHTARMLDIVTRDSMHFLPVPEQPEWHRLLEVMALNQSFDETGRPADAENVSHFLVVDKDNPGSVVQSVFQLRENIRTVRDRVPVELWEETNRLHLEVRDRTSLPAEPFEVYYTIRRRCHILSGIVSEAMPRDEAYTFFALGRMIERASLTCHTIRCLVLRDDHSLDDRSILRTLSSLQAYRRRSRKGGDRCTLAAFLLQAEHVPRTVLSCLRRADGRIARLLDGTSSGLAPAAMVCGRVRAHLEYGSIETELRENADRLVLHVEHELSDLADAIADYAFDPARVPPMQSQFIRPGPTR